MNNLKNVKIIMHPELKKNLHKLRGIKRKKHHPLIHHIHKIHKISKETLLYVKEYGPHSNVAKTIIKESIKVLIFASMLSAIGGFTLEKIKTLFVSIVPLIIMLPVLNDMIGDYGTIISSRFSTMLHEGLITKNLRNNKELKRLFWQIFSVAMIMAFASALCSLVIAHYAGYNSSMITSWKIVLITLIDVSILITLLFFLAIIAGVYLFKREEDPNNFLVPITTAVADFGNMMILAALVILLF